MRQAGLRGTRVRRGATITEFALVLPVILLLIAVCLDFGRVWHHQIVVGNSAGIGVSTAALRHPTDDTQEEWEAEVRQSVVDELSQLRVFEEQVQVEVELDENAPPKWVRVEVNCPFETAINWPGLPQTIVLEESRVSPFVD